MFQLLKNSFRFFSSALGMGLFVSLNALAQDAGASAAPAQSGIAQMIPFVLIFLIFYFVMIRPQKRKLDDEKKFLAALQKGEEVFTKSGIIGKVTGLTDKVTTLEVADGVKIKVLRSQIGGSTKLLNAPDKTADKKGDKKAKLGSQAT